MSKKLFLIIPTMAAGGAERVMSILANEWVKKDSLDVHLVLLATADDFYWVDPNVTIHRLGFFANQGFLKKVIGILKTYISLRRLILREKPQFILSFMTKYNILSIMTALGSGAKVFVSERDSPLVKQSWVLTRLRRALYPRASGIIVQTEDYKNFISKEVDNKRICVIPNPLREVTAHEGAERKPIIVNVGRLVEEKGQAYLLEAFSKLGDLDEWRLVILGDGPLRRHLSDYAKKLNISQRVDFIGAVKNVDEWLARSSIFAFSSISEGFPNALAEAMAAGLPCVSFDCVAGPRDLIVDGENGFLVKQGNVDHFAKRLRVLMLDEKLRRTVGAASMAITHDLDPQMISKNYLDFMLD